MENENQGKTEKQRQFPMFMFSTAMLGLIVLGLAYLIKFGFNL